MKLEKSLHYKSQAETFNLVFVSIGSKVLHLLDII